MESAKMRLLLSLTQLRVCPNGKRLLIKQLYNADKGRSGKSMAAARAHGNLQLTLAGTAGLSRSRGSESRVWKVAPPKQDTA
jgi:hypothetical protein